MEPQRQWTGTTLGAMVWDLFSSAPTGSYVFRNRFDLKSNGRFNFEAEKHVLSPGGGNEYVVITAPKSDIRIKDCDNLILWGGPYPDLESALTGARKWRQIAIAVFPRLALGCDFGDDDEDKLQPRNVDELHFRGMFNLTESDRVYWDRIGLHVLPAHNLPAAFLKLQVDAVGFSGLDDLRDLIVAAEKRHCGVWSDDLRLAYSLVHAALGATEDPEARYVFTVTAIEALIPYRKKHPDLSDVLDALIAALDALDGFDDDTRDSVKDILENNKRDSVNKYGRELAGRLTGQYSGRDPKIFWRDSYKLRSGLAHGNPRSEKTKEAMTKEFLELLRFVLDILESWTEKPGFDSDNLQEG